MGNRTKDRPTGVTVLIWVLAVLLLVGVGLSGFGKLVDPGPWVDRFQNRWGLPGWLVRPVGLFELVGSLALFVPRLAFYGGVLLALVMASAVAVHLAGGETTAWFAPGTLGALAGLVAFLRRSDAMGPFGGG